MVQIFPDVEQSHSAEMKKDLEIMGSKINALEATSADNYQKSVAIILKGLVKHQKDLVTEVEHLRKAVDLLTLQIFKIEKQIDS